jgi:Flp pilus assembly protein TadG
VAPLFVALLLGVSDLTMAFHRQLQLSSALAAGAQYAFVHGQTETGSTLTTDVTNFVNAISPFTLTTVTSNYNNGLSTTSCYCVSGTTPTYSDTMTCGATCTDGSGSTAGKFVSISGKFTYTPLFSLDSAFFANPFTQTVTVRLQ